MYKIEKEFEYKGYKCSVLFDELGYYEGYVEIPKFHLFYDRSYALLNDEYGLNLSYAGTLLPFNDNTFRIGFTCNQRGVKPDSKKVKELWGEKAVVFNYLNMQKISLIPREGMILDVNHAETRLKKLVDIVDEYSPKNELVKRIRGEL